MNSYSSAVLEALTLLGTPYHLGAKWDGLSDEEIKGKQHPIDCSGFSRWILGRVSITLPDGSYNQVKVCTRLPAAQQADPPPLSLGFLESEGVVDHVVVSMGGGVVIEAHGERQIGGVTVPTFQVVLRPASAWLQTPGFLGFYAPPGS